MTDKTDIKVTCRSFGYKYGVPERTNLLCDVRFLRNPYWKEALRPRSGLEPEVSMYVLDTKEAQEFLPAMLNLVHLFVEQLEKTEKKEAIIDVGCTGGRHRSVAVIEWLALALRKRYPDLNVIHRDIQKDSVGDQGVSEGSKGPEY